MNEILMIGSRHGFSFCFCVDGIFNRCQVSVFLSLRMGGASAGYDLYKPAIYDFFYRW